MRWLLATLVTLAASLALAGSHTVEEATYTGTGGAGGAPATCQWETSTWESNCTWAP